MLSLEEMLEKGFTRDDIMRLADTGAFGTPEPKDEGTPEPKDEPTPEPEATPADPTAAALTMMTKMLENQNNMILSLMDQKKAEPEPEKNPTPEEEARKFSDEQLTKALQSLNILANGDKIDIGKSVEKNIEEKVLSKLGSMVGFTVEEKEDKK